MASNTRAQRVGELIREEIAKLLQKGLKDPRVGFVSVMQVRMSTDLKYADVFVSLFGDDKEKKSSLIALKNSEGWVRKQIGSAIRLRFTPEIRFREDSTIDNAYHLDDVFKKIAEEREARKETHEPEDTTE